MITVTDIIAKCNSALDAEGFNTYNFTNDFQPAINYAQQWLMSLFNAAFEKDKKVGEALKDLIYVKCFMTSDTSRVYFDDSAVGMSLWSILHIYPNIEYNNVTQEQLPTPASGQSVYLPDLIYLKSYQMATLKTKNKVNINRLNPFENGNEFISNQKLSTEFQQYSWINHTHYGTKTYPYNPIHSEIELIPSINNGVIAIEFLKRPLDIVATTDNVEFPKLLTNIVVEKCLDWISYKQPGVGYREGVPLIKQMTTQDINNLISLII